MKIQGHHWDIGVGLSKLAKTNLQNAFSYFIENQFHSRLQIKNRNSGIIIRNSIRFRN